MSELEIFLRIAFFGLSLILLILILASLKKVKETKIALATVGFAIFFIMGIVLIVGIFYEDIERVVTIELLIGANFIALVFLYLSIIKR